LNICGLFAIFYGGRGKILDCAFRFVKVYSILLSFLGYVKAVLINFYVFV